MKRILFIIFSLIVSAFLFAMVIRGDKGNPIAYQTEYSTQIGGPYESSNSSSRFAVTKAIVEDHTFFLNEKLAHFSAPDVVYYNSKFFSIFTPGVSIMGVPFYMLGQMVGIPQITTFLSITLFALLNIYLVALIAHKITKSILLSLASGMIFGFSTNALAYALLMTQHHMSTNIILLGLLNAISKRTFLNNLWFGVLVGIGLFIDIPNVMLMAPFGLYILSQHLVREELTDKVKYSLKLTIIGLLIGMAPFIAGFVFYNRYTTGSSTKIAQSIGQSNYFDTAEKKQRDVKDYANIKKGTFTLPFQTRLQVSGFYTLMLSNERAWLYYSPVVLIGFVGMFIAYREKRTRLLTILGGNFVALNILLYAMFGDPWGGWSFGPRYLIPAAAVLCAFIGVAALTFRKSVVFLSSFTFLLAYSVGISSIGAMSTNAIPPKVEAIALATPIPYTYEYNLHLLSLNKSSSLLYNFFVSSFMPTSTYVISFFTLTLVFIMGLVIVGAMRYERKENIL
ncbi:hypothetical protein BH11PAT1_BH11PAT1_8000 [soil metagenome]